MKKINLCVYIFLFIMSILIIIPTCTTPTSSNRGSKHKKKDNDDKPQPIVYPWTKLIGVSGAFTVGRDITVDSMGNIYASGDTDGNLDGQTLSGSSGPFIIKYNSYGIKQWIRFLENTGADIHLNSMTSDSNGNIYITGFTDSNFDGQTLSGSSDLFVVKYDTNGIKLWTRLLGVTGADTEAEGIDADSNGNIYVSGDTNGNLDGQILTGREDLFVVKYDTNGVKQWTKLLGVPGTHTYANDITIDLNGNAYVAGHTYGNLDGQSLSGIIDLCIVKYDTNGGKQWTKLLGVPGAHTYAFGITTDPNGYIYACGSTNGNLDGQTLSGSSDLFVIKYDMNGVKQWTRLIGVPGDYDEEDITTDLYGNIYAAGYTNRNLDGLILTGTEDSFVVKYDTNGVKQWTRLFGAPGAHTLAEGITTDSLGNIYTTGNTDGNLDGLTLSGNIDLFVVKYNSYGIKQ